MSNMRANAEVSPQWDEEYDVIVVGFGCAGACAAIEAADNGARVLIIERFHGGGATKKSGGVIYAGGGSFSQRHAGFHDSPRKMYRYLLRETGTSNDSKTLQAFCASSLDNLTWLQKLGIIIPDAFFPQKTTQPPGGYGLYYSGNEKQYAQKDDPIPRGHVPAGAGMSGKYLFDSLRKGVRKRTILIRYRCRPRQLIVDTSGMVTGLEIITLKDTFIIRALHTLLYNLGFLSSAARTWISNFENRHGMLSRIKTNGGVVLSTGGFIYNRDMVKKHAPSYAGTMPLGTPGDDGSGVHLGISAGGAIASMDACAASRFFCPPEAFVSGILVNTKGERFCDESLYGATISRHISQQPDNRAYLVIDSELHRNARKQIKQEERLRDKSIAQILSGEMNALLFRKAMAFINLHINRKKASSIRALEKACGICSESLAATIVRYNEDCTYGKKDHFGKSKDYTRTLHAPPFYAIDCRLDSKLFPSPCLTLGGLKINGLTAQVLRANDQPIAGLYAAGRSAAGICSRSYVSGLSLADCIFSGRTAGKNAAKAGRKKSRLKKENYKEGEHESP